MQAALEGKTIQVKQRKYGNRPDNSWVVCLDWIDMPHTDADAFNFGVYEYRIAPLPLVEGWVGNAESIVMSVGLYATKASAETNNPGTRVVFVREVRE